MTQADWKEGVTCVSCHQVPGTDASNVGTIVGPFAPADLIKSHPNRQDAKMGTGVELCATCHGTDTIHNQVESWKGSVYEKEGKTCQVCHMTSVKRKLAGKGMPRDMRQHEWKASHDPDFLKKAATLDVTVTGGKVVVTVTNSGAGHNLPGGGERAIVLAVRVVGADGKEAAAYLQSFDLGKNNNRIKPQESRKLEYDAKAASGTVKARLLYKTLIDTAEDKATVMIEKEVKF